MIAVVKRLCAIQVSEKRRKNGRYCDEPTCVSSTCAVDDQVSKMDSWGLDDVVVVVLVTVSVVVLTESCVP